MKASKKKAAKDVQKEDSKEVLKRIDSLKVGVSFDSLNGMKDSIKNWQDKFFMPLVVMRKDKGRLSMMCPHGFRRERRGKPKLKPVHYSGCPVYVNAREQKDGSWKLTKCVVKHSGHLVAENIYNSYRNVKHQFTSKLNKWNPYTREEDENILSYMKKQKGAKQRGQQIWKKMKSDNICPGRTWQSMKDRWIKFIDCKLSKLDANNGNLPLVRKKMIASTKPDSKPKNHLLTSIVIPGAMKSESSLSDYEKIRNNNIRERENMLGQLMSDFGQYKKDIGMVPKPPPKMKKKKVDDDEDFHVQINIPPRRRKSTRLTTRQKRNMDDDDDDDEDFHVQLNIPPRRMKSTRLTTRQKRSMDDNDEDFHVHINIPPRKRKSTRLTTRQKKYMFS